MSADKKIRWMILILVFAITGCARLGPTILPDNRQQYNVALYRSTNEQLLLNIVRMRYGEGIYFLDVSGIQAQTRLQAGISGVYEPTHTHGIVENLKTHLLANQYTARSDVLYLDKPTISYLPVQGAKVTARFLSPLELHNVYLLIRSGWSVSSIFANTLDRIGPLHNVSQNKIHPGKNCSLPNAKFMAFIQALKHWITKGDLVMTLENYSNPHLKNEIILTDIPKKNRQSPQAAIVLYFSDTASGRVAQRKAAQMLHLGQAYHKLIFFTSDNHRVYGNAVPVQPRSVESMIFYLSRGVEVTPREIQTGVADSTPCTDNTFFDWTRVTQGIIRVHTSSQHPAGASTSVYYHHRWYYIAANDHVSKRALDLLDLFIALQSVEVKSNAPLLTLDV